jgi:alkylhydroperoxidase family enzyme
MSYIEPPRRIPAFYRLLLSLVERRLGRRLLANRILAWYPKALLGSGVMEALVAHDEPETPRRLLALVRISTSLLVSCAFCIDLNARDFAGKGVSEAEIIALQANRPLEEIPSLSERERAALRYAACMCTSPLRFSPRAIDEVTRLFSPRAVVIIASTCAQVNFWARLIQALGVPPAGFSAECSILDLGARSSLRGADGAPVTPGRP